VYLFNHIAPPATTDIMPKHSLMDIKTPRIGVSNEGCHTTAILSTSSEIKILMIADGSDTILVVVVASIVNSPLDSW